MTEAGFVVELPVACPYCGQLEPMSLGVNSGPVFVPCDPGCGESFAVEVERATDLELRTVTFAARSFMLTPADSVSALVGQLVAYALAAPEGLDIFVDYAGHVAELKVFSHVNASYVEGEKRERQINQSVYLDAPDALPRVAEVLRAVQELICEHRASMGAMVYGEGNGQE